MRNRRTPKPEQLEKENEVVKLRRGGLTWDLIAERTGYASASSALAAYHRAAKRIVQEDIEQIRKIESERLDIAQSAIWGSVLSGNIPAVTALIRIQERRAKLLGLDQPIRQQIEVTNYDGDTIDREVARLAEYLNSSQTYTLEPPTSES
jgi:hypothetical protein